MGGSTRNIPTKVESKKFSFLTDLGTLLRGLDELRKNGILCDIKLIVENKEFDAHKSVLASCSTYFRVMFTTSMIEKEKEQIEIKDISTEGLDAVLKFIYTNTIHITRNNIQVGVQ